MHNNLLLSAGILGLIALVSIATLFTIGESNIKDQPSGDVLAEVTTTVEVTLDGYGCVLTLNILPGGRTDNFATQLTVQIFESSTQEFKGEFNLSTDNTGAGTINLCGQNILVEGGSYDFYIKGRSHLNELFADVTAFNNNSTVLVLTNVELIAGETSVVYDNYINVLDLTTLLTNFEAASSVDDLNVDGEVNNLDVSIVLNNFYTEGDCSPKNEENGVC